MNKNESLPTTLSNYLIISELGRGAFSTVYKVKHIPTDEIYCLKKINIKKSTHKFNEVKILQSLNHFHLIKFIASFTDDNYLYIIMEYCEFGDLYSLLHSIRKSKGTIMEDVLWDIAYQTLMGLEYIHSKQIIHRDIKLLNIFMTKGKVIKIGDLGMSKLFEKREFMQSRVGTPLYLPPELVKKEIYDYKIDIWSFGCSLYHLAKCHPPFNEENMLRLGEAIVRDTPAPLPEIYSDKIKEFIAMMMIKDKVKRPSASEALKYIPEKIKTRYDIKMNKPTHDSYSSFIHRNKIIPDSYHRKEVTSVPSTVKHNKEGPIIGDAGILLKKQLNQYPMKKRSCLMSFSIVNKMNGTQEGFFKSITNKEDSKIDNKTQSNFFNSSMNSNTTKLNFNKKNSKTNISKIMVSRNNNEFDNLEEIQNDKKKLGSPYKPPVVFPDINFNTVKGSKPDNTEGVFRQTFCLLQRKNLGKVLTIKDLK